jgi:hypothetical protein
VFGYDPEEEYPRPEYLVQLRYQNIFYLKKILTCKGMPLLINNKMGRNQLTGMGGGSFQPLQTNTLKVDRPIYLAANNPKSRINRSR